MPLIVRGLGFPAGIRVPVLLGRFSVKRATRIRARAYLSDGRQITYDRLVRAGA